MQLKPLTVDFRHIVTADFTLCSSRWSFLIGNARISQQVNRQIVTTVEKYVENMMGVHEDIQVANYRTPILEHFIDLAYPER
jgi:hypothetical protein